MTATQILGFVGTGLVIVGYIPQVVHLIKERCTAGISVTAFSLWCAASLLFLIHAAVIRDAVFVGLQTVNLVAGGLIVAFCKRYKGQVCPFHRDAYSGITSRIRLGPSQYIDQVASTAHCPGVNSLSERHANISE